MILIDDIKTIVYAMAQKQRHAAISPDEFSRLAQLANMDEYNYYTSGIKTYYQLGKGMPRIAPGMNKIIDQHLLPFLVTDATMTKTTGVFTLPTDVEFVDTVMAGTKAAKWKPYNLIASYLDSSIDVPTADYPIYTDVATGIKIYPDSVTVATITYLKTPATVNWGYTLNGGRTPVYDAGTSVNFEWGESHKMSLITKILGYIGISIRDAELKQMAVAEEQKSN